MALGRGVVGTQQAVVSLSLPHCSYSSPSKEKCRVFSKAGIPHFLSGGGGWGTVSHISRRRVFISLQCLLAPNQASLSLKSFFQRARPTGSESGSVHVLLSSRELAALC